MPCGQGNTKSKGLNKIVLYLKAVIISMRLIYNEKFSNIEAKKGVKAMTAWYIYHQAYKLAESNDFHSQLAVLKHKIRAN